MVFSVVRILAQVQHLLTSSPYFDHWTGVEPRRREGSRADKVGQREMKVLYTGDRFLRPWRARRILERRGFSSQAIDAT